MEKALETMIGKMAPLLDERQRRIFLGLAAVVALTGVGKNTVYQGKREAGDLPEDPRARPKELSVNK
jgi:hypothetical protein